MFINTPLPQPPPVLDVLAILLQSLSNRNVLSEPVLDEDGEYFGCLSVNDLLKDLAHSKLPMHTCGLTQSSSTLF